MKTQQDLLNRTDSLINMGNTVVATASAPSPRFPNMSTVNSALMTGFRSASLSFIQQLYGNDHPYLKQFTDSTVSSHKSDAKTGIEILKSIREEISGGWLFTIKSLVAAELFEDYISMAEYLLEDGYKDPAAVIAGSVLEVHLRQLCIKNGIETEVESKGRKIFLTATRMSEDLAKNSIYSKSDQKFILGWLDRRNHAAHGEYTKYSIIQIKHMIDGIREFVDRIPV